MNTLLTELDGLDARKSVYVIAATNRPDIIDPAMVRPGRLDKLLYVDLPTAEERIEILQTRVRGVPLQDETVRPRIETLIRERCEGYSGADITAVVREAGVAALKRVLGSLDEMTELEDNQEQPLVLVTRDDFALAVEKVGPSVSQNQRRRYEALRSKFAGLPVRVREEERCLGEVV